MNNPFPPQTPEEYIATFRNIATIADAALLQIEASSPVYHSSLDSIVHFVETLAGMRGDTSIYDATRPNMAEYQQVMYSIENALRNRLIALGYEYTVPHGLSETV